MRWKPGYTRLAGSGLGGLRSGLAGLRGNRDLAYLGYLDHRAQAARANLDALHLAVDHHAAALQVEVEPAIRFAVRVADVMPVHGLAAADITTGGHVPHLLQNL